MKLCLVDRFTVVKKALSHYNAEMDCFKKGGRLATIKDAATNKMVRTLMVKARVTQAFFGLDDQTREGRRPFNLI
jgi:hypothetical protein